MPQRVLVAVLRIASILCVGAMCRAQGTDRDDTRGGVARDSCPPAGLAASSDSSPVPPRYDPTRYPWLASQDVEPLWRRIALAPGLSRVSVEPGSFGEWLRDLPIKPGCPPVRLYDGRLKARQDAHCAVVAIDVGAQDLQQCADAIIRLRAEYLWASGCADSVAFRFTSGDPATWRAWKAGFRPSVRHSSVTWAKAAPADDTYASFRRYLETVFMYAGSASLERELEAVADRSRPEVGDVYIQGGSPGHAAIVVDVAQDRSGDRWFLLAQSFMPAQEIHVLRNPRGSASPWYRACASGPLVTPEWTFRHEDLRRFPAARCP